MLRVWAALGESGSLQSVLSCSPGWSWRGGGGMRGLYDGEGSGNEKMESGCG